MPIQSLFACFAILMGPLAFIDERWIVVPIIILAFFTVLKICSSERRLIFPTTLTIFFIGFIGWAGLSTIWSINPKFTLISVGKLCGIALIALILISSALTLKGENLHPPRKIFSFGYISWIVFLIAELFSGLPVSEHLLGVTGTDYGPHWLKPTIIISSILYWPWVFCLPKKWRFAGGTIAYIALIVISYSASSRGSLIAFLASVPISCFIVEYKSIRYISIAVIVLAVLTAPIVAGKIIPGLEIGTISQIPGSFVARTHIWKFTSDKINERPFLGYGYRTARDLQGGRAMMTDPARKMYQEVMPLHPHNAALEIRVEQGAIGALIFAIFIGWILFTASSGRNSYYSTAQSIFITMISMSSFSFGQSWWLLVIVFGSVTSILFIPREES